MSIKIKHVAWRDGRPRFEPGPALRKAGYKGQDLRHPDGQWFSAGEALDWSQNFSKDRDAQTLQQRTTARENNVAQAIIAPAKPVGTYSVGRLLEDWLASPRVQTKRPATIRDYRQKAHTISNHDIDLWAAEVASLDQAICYGLYEDLWENRGVATARGVLIVLGMAIKWGMRTGKVRGLKYNPARDLDMQAPKPRARFLNREEFEALVKAAEAAGRIDLADMLYCGVWTGQRQTDRLALQTSALRNGRFVLQQSKTGMVVNPPIALAYQERLDAAKLRREAKEVESPFVHLNENTWEPWNQWTYRNEFAAVRAVAAKKLPSVSTVMEKDMRATAITWMALAGNTLPQICAVSGHSLQGAHQILKHYLALHPDMADTAIGNMVNWFDSGASTEMAI